MEELLTSIDTKMNVIMMLLVNPEAFKDDSVAERDKIKLLSDAGLDNTVLAIMFNKTSKQISDQIYKAKKRKK